MQEGVLEFWNCRWELGVYSCEFTVLSSEILVSYN